MCYHKGREYSKLAVCLVTIMCSMSPVSKANSDCSRNTTVERGDCSPWFFATYPERSCDKFGKNVHEVVIKMENISAVHLGYCMTYDEGNNFTYLVACPYDIAKNYVHLVRGQHLLLETNLSELTSFTCDQFHRHGNHCATCQENYGQSIFTMDFGCHSCTQAYRGWGLYLFLELTLLTCFLILLLLLRLSPTNPSIKSFVLFSQLVIMCLSLNYEPPYRHVYKSKAYILVVIIKTFYGFWNLDFFRNLIPHFCVDDNLDNFEVMAFHYISIIYPTVLTAIAWIVVDLHEKGCRPVVRMWKPFRRYLSHYSVTIDPKRTIVSFFATITVLSYTKVIHISASLLNVAAAHTVCGRNDTDVMFLQPDVKYFSLHHVPYVILASLMSFTFVVMPLLILLLYPVGCVQDGLKSFCVKHNNIQMFVEVFQECYSDGTNETKDRRLFSTLYFFHRIIVVLVLVKGVGSIAAYLITAFLHGVVVGLLFGLKPYKQDAYNYLDILFFLVFTVAFLFAAFATNNANLSDGVFTGIFLAMLVPFFYASIRVLVILIKWLKRIDMKSLIQWRRRGYIDISEFEYGIEQSVSMREAESNRNENKRRGGKDSLQSE